MTGTPTPQHAAFVEGVTVIERQATNGNLDDVVAEALFDLFRRTHFSTPKARADGLYRVLNQALIAARRSSWAPALTSMLETPIESLQADGGRSARDQFYWQLTAAEILGGLGAPGAVTALLKAVLSPFKAPIHNDALIALIRIGKPALDASVALLRGQRVDLSAYGEQEQLRALVDQGRRADDPSERKQQERQAVAETRRLAVTVVANIGTRGAVEPLLEVMHGSDAALRTTAAENIHLLPHSDRIIEAYLATYDGYSMSDQDPAGDYPKFALLATAYSFFSPRVRDHILGGALQQKGSTADVSAGYLSIVQYAVNVAGEKQWPTIEKLLALQPKPSNDEEARFQRRYRQAEEQAKAVLDACGNDVDCYFTKIVSPSAEGPEAINIGMKAIHMIGMLGGDEVKLRLVAKLPRVESWVLRTAIGNVLLSKSPDGDPVVVERLRAIYQEAIRSGDGKAIEAAKPLKQIIYRLEARTTEGAR